MSGNAHQAAPVLPVRGRLRPLDLREVRIAGGFWAERQAVNGGATLDHIAYWLEREGWVRNFDLAVDGDLAGERRGREFSDSEIYKFLEAMAWEIGRTNDPDLESRFRALVRRVGAAQEPDGYLNTKFGRPGQEPRWSDLEWGHELYCIGHLVQAAVARARTRPNADDGLLQIACRAADHLCDTFGADGIDSVCGHPVVETALVELARVTGQDRYLTQAAIFVDRRGHGRLSDIEFGREYFQDETPIRQATVLRGHAVRANYLAAGAVDVAVELKDASLLDAVRGQWHQAVTRRTYVTGGQGSRHQDEAFGGDWMLPPDRAYSETCAGIGSVMLAWRLLLADGESRYADLIERTLFNVVSTSPSTDGRSFFYTNTLHRRELGTVPDADRPSLRAAASLRAPWFEVSCCPTNVARTMASLSAYVATCDDEGLQLHQYLPGTIAHRLPDGRERRLVISTDYPHDGEIRVRVDSDDDRPWSLSLRVPDWGVDGATVTVDGATRPVAPGVVTEQRTWRRGDEVVLSLPMVPRFTYPDSRIDAVRGCVAVERGPLVFALESVDVPEVATVDELRIDTSRAPRLVDGRIVVRCRRVRPRDHEWPYRADAAESSPAPVEMFDEVALVPYHAWANRGPSTMRVWIPVDGDLPDDGRARS
ncbi:glycoside hydrolase family 127 protein [Micromonospora craniellae]|uniref:Glycoside hydrolase family 127 protein n=1 Tax=Micromonospora craniellae TaxID=2294034 RepID=A0A372G4D8_9ACTN|nr:beta-L-arabinofuranosidase domain-containing protein [Micromonospora craniellae]QOC92820.1 glycoside hydrolase family 127 protein [Micromonospora craniellae]RFS47600.1 glycoside hydrolase family 127 protein [Micromonospora craniellae]